MSTEALSSSSSSSNHASIDPVADLKCAVLQDTMKQVAILSCGHAFDEATIKTTFEHWITPRCPLCRRISTVLPKDEIVRNLMSKRASLQEACDRYRIAHQSEEADGNEVAPPTLEGKMSAEAALFPTARVGISMPLDYDIVETFLDIPTSAGNLTRTTEDSLQVNTRIIATDIPVSLDPAQPTVMAFRLRKSRSQFCSELACKVGSYALGLFSTIILGHCIESYLRLSNLRLMN